MSARERGSNDHEKKEVNDDENNEKSAQLIQCNVFILFSSFNS